MKTIIRSLEIEYVAIFILVLILALVLAPLAVGFVSNQSRTANLTLGPATQIPIPMPIP